MTFKWEIPFNYINIHNSHSHLGKLNNEFYFGIDTFIKFFQPYLIHEKNLNSEMGMRCMDNCSSFNTFRKDTGRLKIFNFNDINDVESIPINPCTLDLFDNHNYLIKNFNKDNWNRVKMIQELKK